MSDDAQLREQIRKDGSAGRGDSCVAPIQRAKVLETNPEKKMKRKIRGQ